jgi:Cd2+/Zn2+-exporting ATPase
VVDGVEIGLISTARKAIFTVRASTPFSIEMLMSIAAVGAVIIGAIEEAG